jgi:hypothetical protein
VEIVRSFYRAWARNDLPGPVELIDPEIEYVNPVRAVEPGTRRGRAAFGRAVEKVFDGWERWEIELEQLRPVGEPGILRPTLSSFYRVTEALRFPRILGLPRRDSLLASSPNELGDNPTSLSPSRSDTGPICQAQR